MVEAATTWLDVAHVIMAPAQLRNLGQHSIDKHSICGSQKR